VCRLVYRPRAHICRTSIIVLRYFKIFNDDSTLNALNVGLGMGWFGRVSAHSATRPVPIGFGQFQPAMNSKNGKPVGYSGRTDWVCAGRLVRLVGRVGLNASSLIFSISHASITFTAFRPSPSNPQTQL
jgi:hypothetical protein